LAVRLVVFQVLQLNQLQFVPFIKSMQLFRTFRFSGWAVYPMGEMLSNLFSLAPQVFQWELRVLEIQQR
jgi:hypothetical protein